MQDSYLTALQSTAHATHFVLFLARHHLFRFLSKEPLRWGDMYPRPVITIEEATEEVREVMLAVLGVVRVTGETMSSKEEVERMLEGREYVQGGQEEVDDEMVRSQWQRATGREWVGEGINEVQVEIE